MKVPLPWLIQIQGSDEGTSMATDAGSESQDANPPDRRTLASKGGWIAQTFRAVVAAIVTSFHVEHHDNDSHADIHCDTISERDRLVPMGEWIALPYNPSNFRGSGGMTVSVPAAGYQTFGYTLVGKTMTVSFYFFTVTIGGVPDLYFEMLIPAGANAKRYMTAQISIFDSGTWRDGTALVQAQSATSAPYIRCFIFGAVPWTASAANTQITGSITFEMA